MTRRAQPQPHPEHHPRGLAFGVDVYDAVARPQVASHEHVPPEGLAFAQAAVLMDRFDAHVPGLADGIPVQRHGGPAAQERSGVRASGPGEQTDDGGRARAVVAEQRDHLALPYAQIGMAQRRHRTDRFPQAPYSEQHGSSL